eukprot:m.252900 g.252900  ORF g.252900 m.252900 type:complete len:332 (-) comp18018_c0_seq1:22-1017(-)
MRKRELSRASAQFRRCTKSNKLARARPYSSLECSLINRSTEGATWMSMSDASMPRPCSSYALADARRLMLQAAAAPASRLSPPPGALGSVDHAANAPRMPDKMSPWPPARRGDPCCLTGTVVLPRTAMSLAPLATTTGPSGASGPESFSLMPAAMAAGSPLGTPMASHMRLSSLMFGVRMTFGWPRNAAGFSMTAIRASASSTTGLPALCKCSATLATRARAPGSRPRPGPISTACTRSRRARIGFNTFSDGSGCSSGCTMRSGESALMGTAASGCVMMCRMSTPARIAPMPARKGAPVYSTEPPRTARRPLLPLWSSSHRSGTSDAPRRK